jgi:peptidoglycan-associated lipoprotein
MRKLVLVMALVGAVAVVGCGGGAEPETDIVQQPTPPPPPPPPPPKEPEPEPEPVRLDLETIYFDFDKSELTASARTALDDAARQLMANPDKRVVIEGHCDERGTVEYNLALGQRRAHAAMEYLTRKGVEAARMSIISYGEERPVAMGHNEAAWAQNRRAAFVVQG